MYYFVYILSNNTRTTLYTGVTNNLYRRIEEHQAGFVKSFSGKYKTYALVYYEVFEDPYEAITREKQIKGLTRKKKEELIRKVNPGLDNLIKDICE